MDSIKVVLADDHHIVREGIAHLLASHDQFEVVDQAGDGHEAVKKVTQLKPDVLILDITMPKMRGVEVISEALSASPQTKVIILSMHNKDIYIKECMRNGASAYLLKESAVNELVHAIDVVMKGQIYLSPTISKGVVQDWLSPKASDESGPLTVREKEVLKLLAEGHTNKEIAAMLFISPKTVETHRHRINEKLKLGNVTDLVRYAIKEEMITIE